MIMWSIPHLANWQREVLMGNGRFLTACLGLFLMTSVLQGLETPPPVTPDELGPWGERWGQYESFVWFFEGPPKSEKSFAALSQMGMSGSNVQFMGEDSVERKTGFHFYVGDASKKGILHLYENVRDAMSKTVKEKGNRNNYSLLVRPLCLNDPSTLEQLRNNVKACLNAHAEGRPDGYELGDEISVGNFASPVDVCYCPKTLEAMRNWLTEKYGSLAKLNEVWGTNFANWGDVKPMTTQMSIDKHNWYIDQFLKAENTKERVYPVLDMRYPEINLAQWNDHREFMDVTFSGVLNDLRTTAHAIEPKAPIGAVGLQAPSPWGGYDYARISRALDWLEAYDLGEVREINRSFFPRSAPVVQTHFVRNDPKDARSNSFEAWYYFAHGDRGVIIWSMGGKTGVVTNDFQSTPGGAVLGEAYKGIRKDGLDKEILASEFVTQPIAIYYSQPSIRVSWVVDAGVNYDTWPNRNGPIHLDYSTEIQARRAFIDMLENSGYQYRFISYLDVMEKGAIPADLKVLILPKIVALSEKEAKALKEFVEKGGTLIADEEVGMVDEHLKGRQASAVADLFGVKRENNQLVEWFDSMKQHADWDYGFAEPQGVGKYLNVHIAEPGIRANGAVPETVLNGVPVILTNKVGEGKTVYLNLCVMNYNFTSATPAADVLRKKIEEIVTAAGVTPPCKVYNGNAEDVTMERIWYERGKWRYLFVLRNGAFKKDISSTSVSGIGGPAYQIKIVFPKAHEVVNVRTGKVFGDTGEIVDSFLPCEANVYRMWVGEGEASVTKPARTSATVRKAEAAAVEETPAPKTVKELTEAGDPNEAMNKQFERLKAWAGKTIEAAQQDVANGKAEEAKALLENVVAKTPVEMPEHEKAVKMLEGMGAK